MKTRNLNPIGNPVAALVVALLLTACRPNNNVPMVGHPPATPAPTGTLAGAEPTPPAAGEKSEFIRATEQKVKELDAKIDELARKSEAYKDDAKVQADQALATLREQRVRLSEKFEGLRKSSAEAWKELKVGFDSALGDLEKAYENAKSKFG